MSGSPHDHLLVELAKRLALDSETGVLTWLTIPGITARDRARNTRHAGKPAGYLDQGYLRVNVKHNGRNHPVFAHRIVWFMTHGAPPVGLIDHINGITTDNRPSNLREATFLINSQNVRAAPRTSSTGYLGVTRCKSSNRFKATIRTKGRTVQLGTFDCPKAAYEAYVTAKRVLHEGCTL